MSFPPTNVTSPFGAKMTFGPANFFDGVTSARQDAVIELGQQALQIRGTAGESLAEWPYADIAVMSAPEGVLRLGLAKGPLPALISTSAVNGP